MKHRADARTAGARPIDRQPRGLVDHDRLGVDIDDPVGEVHMPSLRVAKLRSNPVLVGGGWIAARSLCSGRRSLTRVLAMTNWHPSHLHPFRTDARMQRVQAIPD